MKKKVAGMILMLVMMITLIPQLAFAGIDDYPAEYKNAAKDALVDAWKFCNRECTSFVAWRLNSRNGVNFTNWYGGQQWGDGGDWGYVAKNLGITVNNTPAVGAVAWWSGEHVAWVEAVDGNNVTIEEYNNPSGSGNYKERTISASNPTGYIHIKDLNPLPIAPKNCQTASWGGRVQIQWETVDNVVGYECGLINSKTNIVDFKANTTDYYYNFYDVPNGTYYAYVAAYNSAGYSSHSNWVGVNVISSAPSAPKNCQTASWNSRVQIQWETVEYASGYECGLIDANSNEVILKADTNDYYYNFYDVPNGTYYAYVVAYNSAGYSSHSNWDSVIVYASDVSPTPVPSYEQLIFSIIQYDGYAEITNNSDFSYTPAIITAEYENGKLKSVSSANIPFTAGEKRTITTGSGQFKVFVWDSLSSMQPLIN